MNNAISNLRSDGGIIWRKYGALPEYEIAEDGETYNLFDLCSEGDRWLCSEKAPQFNTSKCRWELIDAFEHIVQYDNNQLSPDKEYWCIVLDEAGCDDGMFYHISSYTIAEEDGTLSGSFVLESWDYVTYSEDIYEYVSNLSFDPGDVSFFCHNGYRYERKYDSHVRTAPDKWAPSTLKSYYISSADSYSNLCVVNANQDTGATQSNGLWYSEDGGMTWTQSNITRGSFTTIAHVGSDWLALGDSSYYNVTGPYYSSDGKTWTARDLNIGYGYDVAYIYPRWIMGGYSGFYYSSDRQGNGWTLVKPDDLQDYHYVTNGNGTLVGTCAHNSGKIYYSTDSGLTWTTVSGVTGSFNKPRYSNFHWVVGVTPWSADYSGAEGIWYSSNGEEWLQSDIKTGHYDVQVANGIFFAAGSVSTDGKTWTKMNMPEDCMDNIFYKDGVYILTNKYGIYYSLSDYNNWVKADTSLTDGQVLFTKNNWIWYSSDSDNKGLQYANADWIDMKD